MKPAIFFDTSVCIDIAHAPDALDWPRVAQSLARNFRYRISPITVYELVAGLATGGDLHFDKNREAVRILAFPPKRKMLPVVKTFVRRVLFGRRETIPYSTALDFTLWIKAVLQAPSSKALQSGKVRVTNRPGEIGLDLQQINYDMRRIQEEYAKRLKRFLELKLPKLTQDVWADLILTDYGEPLTTQNRSLVSTRLDAAFHFDQCLCRLARSTSFDFLKHKSEVGDAQQFYYLCDEEMYFVSNEKKLKKKISASAQTGRVITYSDLTDQIICGKKIF